MLTVVTLTRGDRLEWLSECVATVRGAMPKRGQHFISECKGDFQATRWETTRCHAGYVAWVDDDDRVTGNALRLCTRALDATGAGIAFTYESRINASGDLLCAADQTRRTLNDVAMHPRSLHHLAVIRPECLDDEVMEHAQRIGTGIDWLMRAYVALKHGAVQVPVVGYEWRQHKDQESKTDEWHQGYGNAMSSLRAVTKKWMKHDEAIRQFLPG